MHEHLQIDWHFGNFLRKLEGRSGHEHEVGLAASLASQATQEGNICLELAKIAGKVITDPIHQSVAERFPDLDVWVHHLRSSRIVGAPGEYRPLILDQSHRLYLFRYWNYERQVAEFIRNRKWLFETVDRDLLERGIERCFEAGEIHNPQRMAAFLAICSSLCVVTGGPGTGKTSLVVKILSLLAQQIQGRLPRIALAAPTGKAAARLKEAVQKHGTIPADQSGEVVDLLPQDAFTLHRLLGIRKGASQPRYHERFPLPYDVVIVDEASMVDLPLMAKLVLALPSKARLVLLGDKEQLASVEPGAVFGDICSSLGAETSFDDLWKRFPRKRTKGAGAVPQKIGQPEDVKPIVWLKHNYRFGEKSRLGSLSRAIYEGEADTALQILRQSEGEGLFWRDLSNEAQLRIGIHELVEREEFQYLSVREIAGAFEKFASFRVLCPLRVGPFGILSVNRQLETELFGLRGIHRGERWYSGRPILITENDYRLKLFNGEIGLIFSSVNRPPMPEGGLQAYFPSEEGGFREIQPSGLPPHETAFAMTVHKAQGSEFNRVLLILPPEPSELLTRELLYTAITRARKSVEVWGRPEIFLESIRRKTNRKSGLREALAQEIFET